ncbi:hypothetical protein C8Q79DRAFT_1009522 [Trametes meyenii]|nr:hypothetical protein C8Q79DRAFT_1009522 [Trametes meyenii]
MGQTWIAVDLDARIRLDEGGTLEEQFWGDGFNLDSIRVPCTNDKINTMLSGRFTHQRGAPLLRLPPELLHEIIDILSPVETYSPGMFLFALTCKFALALARPHIARLQRRHFAPLARHRLICIGSGARNLADYPLGLFSKGEERPLLTSVTSAESSSSYDHGNFSLYELATESWKRHVLNPPSLIRLTDILWRPSAVSRMSAPDFRRFRALTVPHRPDDASWVLCSLSKREYMRCEVVSPMRPTRLERDQRRDRVSECRRRNLLRALLICICWSSDATTNMHGAGEGTSVNKEITRGRWAGDCIELTTLDEMEVGKPWIDVTDDVTRVLQALWDGIMRNPHRDVALEAEFNTLAGTVRGG